MTVVDYSGIAVVIGAIGAFIVGLGNAIMNWRAGKKAEANKQEAMAARAQQTNEIIASAVTPALLTPPPVIPPATTDGDKP